MLAKLRGLFLLVMVATNVEAQLSVPPALLQRDAAKEADPAAAMRLPAGTPARAITLTPPTIVERATPKARRASDRSRPLLKNARTRGLGVGFARAFAAPDNAIRLADLEWHRVADGAWAARIALTSPGAVAIRIELALKDAPCRTQRALRGFAQGRAGFRALRCRYRARDGVLVTGSRRRNRDDRARVARHFRGRQCDARNAPDLAPRHSRRQT